MKERNGFTLLELLVVAGIMALFASLVLWRYNAGNRQYLLNLSAQKVVNDLRRAQNMALASQEFNGQTSAGGFGIYFNKNNDYYVLFADINGNHIFDQSSEEVDIVNFDSGTEIALLKHGAKNIDVTFKPPRPDVYITIDTVFDTNGWVELRTKSGDKKKTINFFITGVIETD